MTKFIRWETAILALLISFAAVNVHAQSDEMPKRPMQLRLTTMRAMLFYENTGKLSADVFTNPVNLWNTTIEGASREGASESMLVTVEVLAEEPGWYPEGRKLQLIARYRIVDVSGHRRPAYFNKTMNINIGTEQKFFGGFWLYETGCHPVELAARIVGQKRWLRKTINLRCGE